jgi:HD-GYP domain-containing protein (c-di-GMP phosphodiesterase class II)
MKNQKDEVIGIFQLINKFKNSNEIISFEFHDMELATSIAGQAAIAIESSHFAEKSIEIEVLTNIGKALATEKDYNKLLSLILAKARQLTQCDSGTIYIVEKDKDNNKNLCFKQSFLKLDHGEFSFPINKKSISGYVALTGEVLNLKDVYNLPEGTEYSLNFEYDKKHYYKTKSMLVVPMTNHSNEVIGILQLINKKKYPNISFDSIESIEKYTIGFESNDIELIKSVAGQAAVAIENNTLYRNIENLFEGFVKASVYAIESRDPPTSGHSERVAIYTVGLAKAVNRLDNGKWGNINFNTNQIKEIRYASLLHDFGKVGVREEVLCKASKLYSYDLELVKSRFEFIKRTLENDSSKRKVQYLLEKSRDEALLLFRHEDNRLKKEIEEVDKALQLVILNNNPKVIEEQMNSSFLDSIAKKTVLDSTGKPINYITPEELAYLSIGKGSLVDKERREIESHVSNTFEFLSQIPWTNELSGIPEIAYAHHEKLNSEGYPNNLNGDKIPNQSKLMTISDIYDALTAGDRPYKIAVSHNEALDILKLEVKSNHIDEDLVKLFTDAKIYRLTSKK